MTASMVLGLLGGPCTVAPSGATVANFCDTPGSLHIPVAYFSIAPVLILAGGSLVVLTVAAVLPKRSRPGLWAFLTAAIGGAAAVVSAFNWADISTRGPRATIGGQIIYDHFTVLFELLIASATVLGALLSDSYLQREGLDGPEAYVLMLLCGSGGMLMAASGGLVMLFLGLEILSISLYVMSAYHRRRLESGEAGLKYFILGSFSSAIFLYGAALVYGATGSTQFGEIGRFLATNTIANNGILLAGMALLIVGLGFKVAAVPFHFWTPDVYQGAPTPFTGYMAAVAKAAGFAGLLRVLLEALPTQEVNWRPAIWVIAVLTLLVGSVLAIVQSDLKRMLAYSSISQAGYVLIGLQAASKQGTAGALFYLLTYTFIILGSFAVVGLIQGEGEARNDLGAVRGLSKRRPALALTMLLFLLAQAGVPFTSGFLAKFYVIAAAVQRGQYALAVIGMLAAAIAAFFYLRVALLMYVAPGDGSAAETAADTSLVAGLAPAAGTDGSGADGHVAGGAVAGGDEADGGVTGGVAAGGRRVATLEAPPATKVTIPFTVGITLAVCAAFTIFAGVSSPVLDFARHANMLF
ncbi:MAG TPA: NADH-quinone oxidoreductase subunit N [Acidimicrobiales bacterium]|nr:NADH-quinone oxidoreductase subunit N [Acidimicrobiales bacterium]